MGWFMDNDGRKKQQTGQYASDYPLFYRRVRRLYRGVKYECESNSGDYDKPGIIYSQRNSEDST
jgi:hypothetical protein